MMLAFSGIASASASANTLGFKYTGTGPNKAKLSATTGAVTFAAAGGSEWQCKSGVESGEVSGGSGARKVSGTFLTLSGCAIAGKACTTAGQASGVIKSGELEGELGYLSETKMGDVGLLLKAKSGLFMSCSAGSTAVEFKGGLIGSVTPVNTQGKSFEVQYSGAEGEQSLTKFVGGTENVLQVSSNKGKYEGVDAAGTAKTEAVEGEVEIAETL
jgi:hypothetical protein